MHKSKLTLLLFLILNGFWGFSQTYDTIYVKYGSSPEIDGIISTGEWEDADTAIINITGKNLSTLVLYKHDNTNFNMVFIGNMVASKNRFPEILLNMNNELTSSWQPDDWWFHVSNGDCHNLGKYGVYDNCKLVHTSWKAANNFQQMPNEVEIQIPFEMIGLSLNDTIGISFLTNDFNVFNHWPSTAKHLIPSTWGTAIFSSLLDANNIEGENFNIFPNPTSDVININATVKSKYRIYSMSGQLIKTIEPTSNNITINMEDFSPGIYFLSTKFDGSVIYKKIVKI